MTISKERLSAIAIQVAEEIESGGEMVWENCVTEFAHALIKAIQDEPSLDKWEFPQANGVFVMLPLVESEE